MSRVGHLSNMVMSDYLTRGSGFLHRAPDAGPPERAEQSPGDRADGRQRRRWNSAVWRRGCRSPTQNSAVAKSFSFWKLELMIPRYTRPEMGRIWSDQNKFQQWLEVELAASEALAELGVVPAEAARLLRAARRLRRRAHPRDRKRSEARRDRLHHRRGRDHGARRARRGVALAALRADFERRGGYRAGAAAAAGLGDPDRAVWKTCAPC